MSTKAKLFRRPLLSTLLLVSLSGCISGPDGNWQQYIVSYPTKTGDEVRAEMQAVALKVSQPLHREVKVAGKDMETLRHAGTDDAEVIFRWGETWGGRSEHTFQITGMSTNSTAEGRKAETAIEGVLKSEGDTWKIYIPGLWDNFIGGFN
jgi:hypothetical protein